MRLKAPMIGIFLLPPSIIGFGWACEQHAHVAVLCVLLFLAGFCTMWVTRVCIFAWSFVQRFLDRSWTYASTLAYIVDANNGRSAVAVATNSAFRGIFAFVATEIAVPMQVGFRIDPLSQDLDDIISFPRTILAMVCGCLRLCPFWPYLPRGCTGWLYTVWGFIMAISGALTFLVMFKGEGWRRHAEKRESRAIKKEGPASWIWILVNLAWVT